MRKQKITISVIGGHDIDKEVEQTAHDIGKIIAEVGAILVCGGLDGAMRAASRGAKEAGGITIGILPGNDKEDANEFIDIAFFSLPVQLVRVGDAFLGHLVKDFL